MKNFVITIPIDENLHSCVAEMGYRLYLRSGSVSKALIDNDPDALFEIFDGMGEPEYEIEYGFGLEITADKPVAGQRVSDRTEIKPVEAAK
jgi:hypothetical protein